MIETEVGFEGLMKLPGDMQEFVMVFLRCRGNIREVEKELGISYPTVCKRLDLVNELLGNKGAGVNGKVLDRGEILGQLERRDHGEGSGGTLKGR